MLGMRAERRFRLGSPSRQPFRVRRLGQRCEPRLGFGKQGGQCLGPHAMAASEIVDRRKPALDALQLLRVEVQAAQVVAQRAGSFFELDSRGLEQRDDLRKRRIVHCGGLETLRQLARAAA